MIRTERGDMDEQVEQESKAIPDGHVIRTVLGVDLLTKIPTVHQMVAYERARAVLYSKHVKIRATVGDASDQYRKLLPIVLDLDSKALAFAQSMLPDEGQWQIVDEWLITDQIDPADLVNQLLGRTPEPDDDAEPSQPKAPAKKAAKAARPTKKTANGQRVRR